MLQVMYGIDYTEPNQDSYRGVVLSWKKAGGLENRKKKIFNCGFPPLDLVDAHNFMIKELGAENILTCSWSSSVDHFVMDGNKYKWTTGKEDGSEWIVASDSYRKTDEYKKLKAKFIEERIDCRL